MSFLYVYEHFGTFEEYARRMSFMFLGICRHVGISGMVVLYTGGVGIRGRELMCVRRTRG
jgi:hypothetical protein